MIDDMKNGNWEDQIKDSKVLKCVVYTGLKI